MHFDFYDQHKIKVGSLISYMCIIPRLEERAWECDCQLFLSPLFHLISVFI